MCVCVCLLVFTMRTAKVPPAAHVFQIKILLLSTTLTFSVSVCDGALLCLMGEGVG